MTPLELKKHLVSHGFEVYRRLSTGVALAERVRENLILDSGIRVIASPRLQVQVVFRAEGGGFPGESEEACFSHAHDLARVALALGFTEVDRHVARQMAPSAPDTELDRFYEIVCVHDAASLEQAVELARSAFAWPRSTPEA